MYAFLHSDQVPVHFWVPSSAPVFSAGPAPWPVGLAAYEHEPQDTDELLVNVSVRVSWIKQGGWQLAKDFIQQQVAKKNTRSLQLVGQPGLEDALTVLALKLAFELEKTGSFPGGGGVREDAGDGT